MACSVALLTAALVAGSIEPLVETGSQPKGGMSIATGVQRLQDDFGLTLELSSPRFLDGRFAVIAAGGIGWYPDLRALPASEAQQDFGAWSLYAHGRLLLEVSTRIALGAGRLYAAAGPSVLLLPEQISTTRFALGVYGAIGAEIFAGDEYRTYPFSLYAEIGGVAHDAAADVARRTGSETTDTTVDRLIATGLAISGGVRIYLW